MLATLITTQKDADVQGHRVWFVNWIWPFNRIMWIQTLPNSVQSRVLSFLTLEHRRFYRQNLAKFARNVLSEAEGLDCWVKKAAHQLLDKESEPSYKWVSCLNLDSEEERFVKEFESLRDWLKDKASSNGSISRDELNSNMP
ncbi:Fanconi anemia group M protein [Actinidia chinensis var. chinensis]|uniref:Fanconi anemia group M protein n=1 Tax=Actinidia chinensis var. chinensis TaxID=1590841 RepID=A0A2R6R483_ACTCC|nr:Fanconi anemia group M protein [Actinidia chinensis var. chinensis]